MYEFFNCIAFLSLKTYYDLHNQCEPRIKYCSQWHLIRICTVKEFVLMFSLKETV